MKNIIKILAFVLALVMLSSAFVGCGKKDDGPNAETGAQNNGGGNNADNSGNNNNADDSEVSTEAPYISKLTGLRMEGDYRVLGFNSDEHGFKDFEIDYDEIPGDVVGLAVWNRNAAIKEKYGLDVVGTLSTTSVHTLATVFLGSGDDQYDLIICENDKLLGFAQKGELANINALKYVDFDHEAWNKGINEQFTYGNKMYYTSNKFLLQEKHRTWMIWYNRTLAEQLKIGHLENEVFAGTWTIDKVIEISRTSAANIDGKDGMTSTDQWGFVTSDPYTFAQLAYGCGFRLSNKVSNGYPELIGPTDQMMAILDKVFELSSNQNISFFSEYRPTADENTAGKGETIFKDGKAVLMGHCIAYLDNVHKLNFKYGVLPNPKYTVEQENYISLPNWKNGHLLAIPASVADIDKAGFGLEALAEESVSTTYSAYIDERCKLQDAEDLDMAECLGIIFDNVAWDVVFIDDLGGLGGIMRGDLLKTGTNTYKRMYDQKKKRATNKLKDIKEDYEKNDALGAQ